MEYLIEREVEETSSEIYISHGNTIREMRSGGRFHFDKIYDGERIDFEIPLRGAGGPFIEFADVDEISNKKKLNFSKKAPEWRKVVKGLNLFGNCINKECKSYNKEVIYNVGINLKLLDVLFAKRILFL